MERNKRIRLLAGARLKSERAVTGAWDRARPMDGAYAALLTFDDSVSATLTYCGDGDFDSDKLQGWIGEMGQKKEPVAPKRMVFSVAADEADFKQSRNYGGANYRSSHAIVEAHQNFGTFIASCERADLRPMTNGVMVYKDGVGTFDPLPPPVIPRVEVIDELYNAVVEGISPRHSSQWAMGTLEVCLAMLRPSRQSREIGFRHQG